MDYLFQEGRMKTIKIKKKVWIYKEKEVEVETVRFLNARSTDDKFNSLKCSACLRSIGKERPIAIAYASERSYRLCRRCSCHLQDDPAQKTWSANAPAERNE
jgi:hypothetical protein